MRRRRSSTRRHPYMAMGPTAGIGITTVTGLTGVVTEPTDARWHTCCTLNLVEVQQVCSKPSHEAALAACRGELGRRNLSILRPEDVRLAGLAGGLLARRAQHPRVGAPPPPLRVFGHVAARHQHGDDRRHVPDGLPDPEHPEPRRQGGPPEAR